MAFYVLKNCKLYVGGYDLSGDMNEMGLDYEAEAKDATTFGASGRQKIPGLLNTVAHHRGLYQAGVDKVDPVLWGKLALADEVVSIYPQAGLVGEVGYTFKSVQSVYSPGASIGEIFAFNVTAEGSGPLVRATLLATGAKTITGNGAAYNLGAVSASQKLYAAMHVLAVSGTSPTLDVTIQSDDAEGFGTPITRVTFAQATVIGAQWATPITGPITDTWWRASWAIGGTGSPSFTVIIEIGIQ